jgi:hypothetical protein
MTVIGKKTTNILGCSGSVCRFRIVADADLAAGTIVAEYVGEAVPHKSQRADDDSVVGLIELKRGHPKFEELGGGISLTPDRFGNIARFLA